MKHSQMIESFCMSYVFVHVANSYTELCCVYYTDYRLFMINIQVIVIHVLIVHVNNIKMEQPINDFSCLDMYTHRYTDIKQSSGGLLD